MSAIAPLGIGVVLQLYWLSLLLFGYVLIHAFYGLRKRQMPRFWVEAPFFAKILLVFAGVACAFSIWSLVGYAFKLPAWWLPVSYITTALFSGVYAGVFLRQKIYKDAQRLWNVLRQLKLFSLITLAGLLLVADFIFSLHLGSYLFGDAMVHMAKSRALAASGFSLVDPAFGEVLQTSYMFTFWHTLWAIPVSFGVDVTNSWFYALPIAKLLVFSAIFYLSWRILLAMGVERDKALSLSTFTLILAIILPSTTNTNLATYPKVMIVAWVVLFVTGLMSLVARGRDNRSIALLLMASFLIAMTHALYPLFLLLFLALTFVVFLIFGREYLNKRVVTVGAVAGIILATAPIIAFVALRNAHASLELPIYTQSYSYWSIFGFQAFVPDVYRLVGTSASIGALVFALLGCAYLLLKLKNKPVKLIAISMLLTPLLISVPFIFGLLHTVMPYWALHRLNDINVFIYISVSFGLIAAMSGVVKYCKKIPNRSLLIGAVALILVLLAVAQPFPLSKQNVSFPYSYRTSDGRQPTSYDIQKELYAQLTDVKSLTNSIPKGSVVLAPTRESFMLPAVADVRVVATPAGNTNALININGRLTCKELIFEKIDEPAISVGLMKQIGVEYILARKNTDLLKGLKAHPKYFRLISKNDQASLYVLNGSQIKGAYSSKCYFND